MVPDGQYEPSVQLMVRVALGQYRPAEHCWADVEPVGQKVPEGHWIEAVGSGQYLPMGHSTADVEGTGQYVPSPQLRHTAPL